MAETKTKKRSQSSTVESKRLDRLESIVGTLAEKIEVLVDEVRAPKPAEKMLRSEDPDARLDALRRARIGDTSPVSRSRVRDLTNPMVRDTGPKPDDFITLTEDSELYGNYFAIYDEDGKATPASMGDEGAQPAVGIVLRPMYVKRNGKYKGEWKYLVKFEGFGQEGVMASEMVRLQ